MAAWRRNDDDPNDPADRWPHTWGWFVWALILGGLIALAIYTVTTN